mgnify:CR=1 FL=1
MVLRLLRLILRPFFLISPNVNLSKGNGDVDLLPLG